MSRRHGRRDPESSPTASAGKVGSGWLADRLPGEAYVAVGSLLAAKALGGGRFLAIIRGDTLAGPTVGFAALGLFALGATGLYCSSLSTVVADAEIGAASAGGQLAATVGDSPRRRCSGI